MTIGRLDIARAFRAPLWVRIAVFGVIGVLFALAVRGVIAEQRKFASDQYERGEAFGRAAVANEVSAATERLRLEKEAERTAANARQTAMRAQAAAELAAMKGAYETALKEAQKNDPLLAQCLALPAPRQLRDDAQNGDSGDPGSGS